MKRQYKIYWKVKITFYIVEVPTVIFKTRNLQRHTKESCVLLRNSWLWIPSINLQFLYEIYVIIRWPTLSRWLSTILYVKLLTLPFTSCGIPYSFVTWLHSLSLGSLVFSGKLYIRGAYDKFPDFFCMGTFIDSTHMKL